MGHGEAVLRGYRYLARLNIQGCGRSAASGSPSRRKARSLNEIGAELAALGYTTSKGRQFSAEQIRRLVGRV